MSENLEEQPVFLGSAEQRSFLQTYFWATPVSSGSVETVILLLAEKNLSWKNSCDKNAQL